MNHITDLVPDPEVLMFGDEAHKDERTSNRQMGWSRREARCVQRKSFVRSNQSFAESTSTAFDAL